MSFARIGVVGAGSWGTALALLLQSNGGRVTLWGHDEEHLARIGQDRENRVYLPGIAVPETISLSPRLEAITECDLILIATPSKALREVAARLSALPVQADAALLSCVKGVERGSGRRMSEILREFFPSQAIAVLSGPSHAEEVARQRPTAVVLACADNATAQRLQGAFSTPSFRAYTNDDVAGVEFGGALKNIFAIAAGVCDGLGLGDNSKAALVTRALAEMVRLGVALGGRRETFQGLSGLGDLVVTCFSRHSRNRAVGERLGRGESLAAIQASMAMVAEGVPTTYSACECARRHDVPAPIAEQIRALLDGATGPQEAVHALLSREPKPE